MASLIASMCRPIFLRYSGKSSAANRDMAANGEVWAIQLQNEPGVGNRFVFVAHHGDQRLEIRVVRGIVLVVEEHADDTGRSGGHEHAVGAGAGRRCLEVADVRQNRVPVLPGNGACAGRRLQEQTPAL